MVLVLLLCVMFLSLNGDSLLSHHGDEQPSSLLFTCNFSKFTIAAARSLHAKRFCLYVVVLSVSVCTSSKLKRSALRIYSYSHTRTAGGQMFSTVRARKIQTRVHVQLDLLTVPVPVRRRVVGPVELQFKIEHVFRDSK
jgi:hypothetical protein